MEERFLGEADGGPGQASNLHPGNTAKRKLSEDLPVEGMSYEMHELYKSILESNKLRKELKEQLEMIALRQSQEQADFDEVRAVAAEQARAGYRCDGCGLWFVGILDFAEHDELTGHMKNRGKKVTINGHGR
jgi:rubrerythrin